VPTKPKKIKFKKEAQEDLDYFNQHNKKKVIKIFELIEDIQSNPFRGKGKPEPLKHQWQGCWSRRIDDKGNRLIYKVESDVIIIVSCRFHYKK